jgi:hypothetical protein
MKPMKPMKAIPATPESDADPRNPNLPKESRHLENEITPEMIEAGIGVLLCYHREHSDEADVVRDVFKAMTEASGVTFSRSKINP